jgi:lipopolysaccharide transport system ATP-binding protein
MTGPYAIRLQQVAKRYELFARPQDRLKQLLFGRWRDYGERFSALQSLNLDIAHGEIVGVIGRNGAGKSTLLQLICGTLTPSEGQVEVGGRIAALLELGAGFNPDFSGRENVYLNAAILGLSRAEVDAKFEDIAAFSGIGDFLDHPVKTYSSGMYIRLAFSVAIHIDPQILIIDEALSVGDGIFARKSFERIMQLKEAGKTILFCSHSMYQVEALCTRAIWLERGELRRDGKPADVVAAYTDFLRQQEDPVPPLIATEAAPPQSSGAKQVARLLDIKALTPDNEAVSETDLVTGTIDLRLRIRFQCDPTLPAPCVAVGLALEDGRTIASCSTQNDHLVTSRNAAGFGEAILTYPGLALLKGHYLVDVWLLDETGLHLYDTALAAISLRVTQRGLEQGFVSLPHAWHLEPSKA